MQLREICQGQYLLVHDTFVQLKTQQIAACKRPAWLLLMKWFVLILGKETNTSKLEARRNTTFNEY